MTPHPPECLCPSCSSPPLLAGGQGRDAPALKSDALEILLCLLGIVLVVVGCAWLS